MSTRYVHIAWLALAAVLWTSGCATYSDSVRQAHRAVALGHPERAVTLLNKQMEADNSARLPKSFEDDNVLLLMERATVLQSLGKYNLAARDLMAADDHLEWMSLSDAGSVDIAKYVYSGSSKEYVAPAYERLLLNTLNILNFLAMRDLQGAKVEARRFTILEQFFLDNEEPAILSGLLALGNYLGAAAFEHSRDYEEAARYYSRAWHYGIRNPSFRKRLVTLLYLTGYKPRDLEKETDEKVLTKLLEDVSTHEPTTFKEYREKFLSGDTIIVVQTGLVPWRRAVRVPIGMAMTYAGSARYHPMSGDQQQQLNLMVTNGTIESVNFPMLTTNELPADKPVTVNVDGTTHALGGDIDVASQVQAAYAHILPTLMAAAITRLITRIAAGQVTESAVEAGSGKSGLGFLAKLAVEGAMNIADKPDTRSWMTLPGRIRLVRVRLSGDTHPIRVGVGKDSDQRNVLIRKDSLNVVNFSRIR